MESLYAGNGSGNVSEKITTEIKTKAAVPTHFRLTILDVCCVCGAPVQEAV